VDATRTLEVKPERLDALLTRVAKLEQELEEYKKLNRLLQEANERLKRGLLGQKAERLPEDTAQLSLSLLQVALEGNTAAEPASTDEAAEQTIPEHTRKKPVRKPLPENLPRVTIEITPMEVQREGLDAFERVGAETREVLERRPASAVVVELVYPKYVRKDRERGEATEVLVSEAVEMPIVRGLAGPGMLADTVVKR
jgi:hypothetical protein